MTAGKYNQPCVERLAGYPESFLTSSENSEAVKIWLNLKIGLCKSAHRVMYRFSCLEEECCEISGPVLNSAQ